MRPLTSPVVTSYTLTIVTLVPLFRGAPTCHGQPDGWTGLVYEKAALH